MANPGGIRPRLAVVFGAWTVLGLLWAGQVHFTHEIDGSHEPFWQVLTMQMTVAWSWGVATYVVLWLGRRFPFEPRRFLGSLAAHALFSLALVLAINLIFVFVGRAIGRFGPYERTPALERVMRIYVGWLDYNVLIYWSILGLSYGVEYYRGLREKELKASQLETQLANARLDALEMQLHPHFLFNALHTISGLVRTNQNALAIRVTAGLGDLLRSALDRSGVHEVPLRQELEFIERYLEIEQIRFGDRLKVEMDVDPEVLDARVPYLILQPLVENAIRHGIAPRAASGSLAISARRADGHLRLTVADDGPGFGGRDPDPGPGDGHGAPRLADGGPGLGGAGQGTAPARQGGAPARRGPVGGLGLSNTRARLEELYGSDQSLDLANRATGGAEVVLTLPLSSAAAEWRA